MSDEHKGEPIELTDSIEIGIKGGSQGQTTPDKEEEIEIDLLDFLKIFADDADDEDPKVTEEEAEEEPTVILQYPEYDGGSPYLADLGPVVEFIDGVRTLTDSDRGVDKRALMDFYERSDDVTQQAMAYIMNHIYPKIKKRKDGSEERVYNEGIVKVIAGWIWEIADIEDFDDENTCPFCGADTDGNHCDNCGEDF